MCAAGALGAVARRQRPGRGTAARCRVLRRAGSPGDGHARLEVIFDKPRPLDDWTCQLIEAATQLSSMVLELERAIGRGKFGSSLNRSIDGAPPLIGASEAIRRVRERIERVAATDFTVLIEGGSGPQPHPSFIEFAVELPSVEARGRWRERGRMGRT